MGRHAIYPGTFDPITNGHVDVIERAAKMFDRVTVLIAINSSKQPLFSQDERKEMATDALSHLSNISVVTHAGLVVEYAREHAADAVIRGIRAVSDFEYEFQIALMNRKLCPEISTIFLLPHERYTYLNSSIVRELAAYDQDLTDFVPPNVALRLKRKHT